MLAVVVAVVSNELIGAAIEELFGENVTTRASPSKEAATPSVLRCR
jgi:hypothetical protein